MGNHRKTEKLVFIALLVALSVVLGIFDRYLSMIFTSTLGVKIGLANIIILTGLYYLNFRETLILILLKTLLTGLIFANPMTFLISFSGTILSYITMFLLLRLGKEKISTIGVSLSGSIMHNIGQVIAVIFLYPWTIIFSLFWLLPLGIVTGFFIGNMVIVLKKYLDKGQIFKTITQKDNNNKLIDLIDEND